MIIYEMISLPSIFILGMALGVLWRHSKIWGIIMAISFVWYVVFQTLSKIGG